jgi:hypothetical protein
MKLSYLLDFDKNRRAAQRKQAGVFGDFALCENIAARQQAML